MSNGRKFGARMDFGRKLSCQLHAKFETTGREKGGSGV